MPRGRRGVHVDVSVHGGGHHHHGHGHGHHHHHHGGAGKVVAAGLVGAAAGAAVASKSNNKSQPPPKQGGTTVVVVQQQPSQPPPQQYQPPPQQYQPPPQQYQPPPQQYQPPPQQHQGPPPGASVTVAHQGPGGNTQVVHVEAQGQGQGPKRATVLGKRFKNGNTVFLHSVNSKEHVRSKKLGRKLDASGGNKDYSQWVVERVGVDRVKFRNVGHSSSYLRIQSPNQADDLGEGGVHCEFWVAKHGRYGDSDRVYSFESVAHPGNFLGFTPKGDVKAPKDTGLGPAGQFHVRVHKWS